MEKKKPRVFIAMPCYDTMKVETCVSILNTYAVLAKSGVECIFQSVLQEQTMEWVWCRRRRFIKIRKTFVIVRMAFLISVAFESEPH